MFKIGLILGLQIFISAKVFSQNDTLHRVSSHIVQDIRIDSLISRYTRINAKRNGIAGYRVQISSGIVKDNEAKVRAEFLRRYSDYNAYIEYVQPNYIIKVGDFRTRLKAQQLLDKIKNEFRLAFIVHCDIKPPNVESDFDTDY